VDVSGFKKYSKAEFVDLPNSTSSKKVNNLADPEATTMLMAHTEYLNDSLLVKTL
jgi:hypothetical protein